MKEYNIQRRIGYISAAACLTVIVLNLILKLFILKREYIDVFAHPNIWLYFLLGICSYYFGLINKQVIRLFQVALFFLLGIFLIIWNSSDDLTGQVFIVIGVLLASQYNLLKDKMLLKMSVVVVTVILSGIISFIVKQETGLYYIFGHFLGSIGILLVFVVIFSEDIKALIRENKKLQTEMESHRSFVEVGQNVTGLVHNFKGITQGLENYSYLLERASGRQDGEKLADYSHKIREGVAALSRRIDNILMAVRAMNDNETKVVDANRMIESTVELFNTIRDFKQNMTVQMDFNDDIRMKCNVNECSQVFENIIRNAWEAIMERKKYEDRHYGELQISTQNHDGMTQLFFRDNGIGIKECTNCDRENCLDCERWKIGRTTKRNGSGFGMVFITKKVKEYGGDLKVISGYREGTEIQINLKK